MSGRDSIHEASPVTALLAGGATSGPEVVRLAAVGTNGLWLAGSDLEPVRQARSVIDLCIDDVDAEVLVVHEQNDRSRPVIVGRMRSAGVAEPSGVQVDADGQRLTVSARERLVLRCGESSITLTRSGKVLISGRYVSSRAIGVNAVKGGSIELN